MFRRLPSNNRRVSMDSSNRGIKTTFSTANSFIVYSIYLILTVSCTFCDEIPCDEKEWWNSKLNSCVQCLTCSDNEYVRRPCQLHRDIDCAPISELNIDLGRPLEYHKREPNWKERRKDIMADEQFFFDWQTTLLVLAVLMCAMFFIIVGCMLLQHMRQWRRMERQLDRDVEELSAKLMARLAEVQTVNKNGGTFLIDNPIKSQNTRPVEVKCVYLDQLLEKDAARMGPITSASKREGNLYIEGICTTLKREK